MTAPELAPRSTAAGIVAVWIAALAAGVVIAVAVPFESRAVWFLLALAGALVLAFAIQLGYGRSSGFIERVGASVVGALLVLGLISAAVGLATIIPG